jgi:adenylate kinase
MRNLILFGRQGSGKGTQARILAEKLNCTIFETGGQLRALATENSELGRKVKQIIETGKLVSDEVIMKIVANFLSKNSGTAIFDGIPRSESQRILLEQEFKKINPKPLAVVIQLSEAEALKRLLGRKTCAQCGKIFGAKDQIANQTNCPVCHGELKIRADDTEEAIKTRLKIYTKETLPILKKYHAEDRLIEVDGMQSVENVTAEILKKL